MDKRKIIFRADGGPTIGMGHFIRSLALAEMLNQDFSCVFATSTPSEYQIAEIKKVCHDRIDLPGDDSHFEVFLGLLNGNEIVVLDNYYFDTDYQKAVKAKGCKLVCIDDMHDKHFVADIVINHAEGIEPLVYSIEKYTQVLLGYKYALLRKEFRKEQKRKVFAKYSALVIMGGADPYDITSDLMQHLEKYNFSKPIVIVGGNVVMKELDKFIFFKRLNASKIAELMENSEFGIFPASTVAIEACGIGLPFICGYFIDNQVEIYRGIEKSKLAICIGSFDKLSSTKFKDAISSISSFSSLLSFRERQNKVMDSQIKTRISNIFMEL